jgi:serine/threonine-protein kinase
MPDTPTPAWTPDTDRNLLFGVLCLQADLIDDAQFADACAAWARRRDVPLADVLADRGWLDDAARRHVEFLLERKLQKHNGDVRQSLGQAAGAGVRDVLRSLDVPAVQQSLCQLPPAPGYVLVTTMDHVLGQRSRYTLTRVYAEGGLGRVYVAHDRDVNREVALKELLPERAKNPDAWARFFREAQLTGQLEHPNIVPVYEIGQREGDDQPFYAMRLVRGRTLREAIREYHARRAAGADVPLDRVSLLRAFETVCQAIGYAHSRGVVHRDLKPDNVMLGDFGQVIVLDWGLAKVVDRPEDEASQPPVAVTDSAQTDVTIAGRMLGTPAYAAPEQVEGRIDLIDARTDVYGLGAMLFEILTGRPPHVADNTAELIRHVIQGESPRARSVEPVTPKALDAICAKAMAKVRADRYLRAVDLAADVQHFLADEPVTAYREPFATRAGRWARRHRSLVGTGAALAVVVVVFLGALAVLLEGARSRTDKARSEAEANFRAAEEQRARAEANFQTARKTVDDYYTRVSENKLLGMPALEPLRRELLEQALMYYQGFATESADDPKVRADHATAVFRVATITELIGTKGEAHAHYRRAVELFEQVLAYGPDNPLVARRLGTCQNDFGVSLMETGDMPEAGRQFAAARDGLDRLAAAHPNDPEPRAAQAKAYLNTALWNYKTGATDEAYRWYDETRKIQEGIVGQKSDVGEYQADLTLTVMNLGSLYLENGRTDDALENYQRALKLIEPLVLKHAQAIYYSRLKGALHHNIGLLNRLMNRPDQALSHYQEARAIRQRLHDLHPAVIDYQNDLGETLNNVGELQLWRRDKTTALATLGQAADLFGQIATDNPTNTKYKSALALAHNNYGVTLHQLRKWNEALAEHQAARRLREELVRDNPTVIDYQAYVADTHSNLGNTLRGLGRKDEALAAYEAACRQYEPIAAAHPTTTKYKTNLALAYSNAGFLLEELKRPEEALAVHQKALAVRQELAKACPAVPRFRAEVAQSHFQIGKVYTHLGYARHQTVAGGLLAAAPAGQWFVLPCLPLSPDEAEKNAPRESFQSYQQAMDVQAKLVAEIPTDFDFRADLGRTHIQLGNLLRDTDKQVDAFKAYKDGVEVWKKVVADCPADPEFRSNFGVCQYNFGITLQELRLALAALKAHQDSLPVREKLADEFPEDVEYQRARAETYNSLGIATLSLRRRDEALGWFQKAHDGFKALYERDPEDPTHLSDYGRTLLNRGITLSEMGKNEEALALVRQSMDPFRAAVERRPARFRDRELLGKAYERLGKIYRAMNHPADAAAMEIERGKLWPLYPPQLIETAGGLAQCVPLVGVNPMHLTEAEMTERLRYADLVLSWLRQAEAWGYRDWAKVKFDARFDAVRERAEFQKLVAGVSDPPPAAKAARFPPPGFNAVSWSLLSQQDVRDELDMKDDQWARVQAARARTREPLKADEDRLRDPKTTTEDGLAIVKRGFEADAHALADTLTPAQLKRLRQVHLHQQGVHALADAEVEAAIGLSDPQKDRVRVVREELTTGLQRLHTLDPGVTREAKERDLPQQALNKGLAILTDEQKKAWKNLVGEPFQRRPRPTDPPAGKGKGDGPGVSGIKGPGG